MKNSLTFSELDSQISRAKLLCVDEIPSTGWIKSMRTALGMSQGQLAKKVGVTRQKIQDLERREKDGNISLKALQEVAEAMDMQLVYGFKPDDGSIEALVDRKATELATRIVMRAHQSMILEGQQISSERLRKAIDDRAQSLKNEMPKILWD